MNEIAVGNGSIEIERIRELPPMPTEPISQSVDLRNFGNHPLNATSYIGCHSMRMNVVRCQTAKLQAHVFKIYFAAPLRTDATGMKA